MRAILSIGHFSRKLASRFPFDEKKPSESMCLFAYQPQKKSVFKRVRRLSDLAITGTIEPLMSRKFASLRAVWKAAYQLTAVYGSCTPRKCYMDNIVEKTTIEW